MLEPADGVIAIGSGGPYALAAARALIDIPGLSAMDIGARPGCVYGTRGSRAPSAKKAMKIAADTCIYTNHNFTIDSLPSKAAQEEGTEAAAAPPP